MVTLPILSLLIWLPVVSSALVLISGGLQKEWLSKFIAVANSLVCMALCIPLYTHFDTSTFAWQFRENIVWISAFGIHYDLGVDGISMPLVTLTVFTTLIVVLGAMKSIKVKLSQYLATFLIMQSMVIGVFAALDAMLFYVFWEGMLIPMYLSIGIWGSSNRSYAAIKFFLYTFLGSALMFVALLYLAIQAGSFYIPDFYSLKIAIGPQLFLFVAFLLAFAVKVPMWPVHTWLPDAHTEAPAGGSVILAALMLKVGTYGFFRFSLPIVPDACHQMDWFMIGLSLVAIVYIGLVAIVQTDMKKLIAYSSIAHMGFVTLGSFMLYIIVAQTGNPKDAYMGLEGAMVQMISHAFGAGAMFLGFGMLYDRLHTREISRFGGIANTMPIFAACFLVFAMANVGLPGTSGFVGEFMVILNTFKASFWVTFAASSTLIIGAAYTLWMYKRVFYGEVANDEIAKLEDVDWSEFIILFLLVIPIIVIGVYPDFLLNLFHTSIGNLLELSLHTKL